MLLDMLLGLDPKARVFALDTHVLFPETYAVWREVERRYGTKVEVYEGPSLGRQAAAHGDELWETQPDLCCAIRKVEPLGRALGDLDALDHRPPPRPVADARRRAEGRLGRDARAVEGEPARRLGRRALLGLHPRARPALQPAARPRLRRRSAARTARSRAPAARAAGPALTRPSAASTSLVRCRARARERLRRLVHGPLGRRQVDDRRPRRRRARGARPARRPPRRRRRARAPDQGPRLLEGGPRHEHRAHRLGRLAARARRRRRRRARRSRPTRRRASARARSPRSTRRSSRSTSRRRSRSASAATRRASTRRRIAGEIAEFTGVSDPYEEPSNPELRARTPRAATPEESAALVLAQARGARPRQSTEVAA